MELVIKVVCDDPPLPVTNDEATKGVSLKTQNVKEDCFNGFLGSDRSPELTPSRVLTSTTTSSLNVP